ncbi:hypothetical protein [Streptomyces sp. 5-10]|uniref:hypothetical protein n=1 Tax=Streptomyces sp. 5-10 TaxID=878925 RepID=UPI00295F216F|nr:hypothetical protein [Streptomyces sp. 5-10]
MTACAFDTALTGGVGDRPRGGFTIASDRSYGARLALSGEAGRWYPERWTLDGPEPYAVPLPAAQPEEPDSELLPLADGQVLIHRRVAGHHAFSLLYPTGPGTGERPLGAIDRAEVSLLPPAPGGLCAFALGRGPRSTSVWLLFGGGVLAPQHLAEVPGRCTGGSWLDRTGRLLALDRELDGRTKTVVVDLRRGGETSPLLQITERSDDRLLLADPDSGLLLVRSDAPGEQRLGWGVLGSTRPVRFPDCLRPAGWSEATPFAVQPGQVLTPEVCAVAFRIDGRGGFGSGRPWVGVWRPAERRLREFPAPEGWLPGAGLWTRDGELRLPYVTPQVPCGLARVRPPGAAGSAEAAGAAGSAPRSSGGSWVTAAPGGTGGATSNATHSTASAAEPSGTGSFGSGPFGSAEARWRPDDTAAPWAPGEATGARRIAGVTPVTEPSGRVAEPPDPATTRAPEALWRRDDATGARRIAPVTAVPEPSGRAAEAPWRPDDATGPWASDDAAAPWGSGEASGARRIAGVTRASGPAAAEARGVQASRTRTMTPPAGIPTRITPWTRVGGPGASASVRASGPTPEPMPSPSPSLSPSPSPSRAPEPMPLRERVPMAVHEPVPMAVHEPVPMAVHEPVPMAVHERVPEPECGSGVEPWGGTGSWAGVEQEMGPEPEPAPGTGLTPALRPVPLQQAPLARPPRPRPPRWVRDHPLG